MGQKKLGIIDADLLDNGTRHPNLACMKISAYYKEQGWKVKLLEDYNDLEKYDLIMLSKVFSFTKVNCSIYKKGFKTNPLKPEEGLKKNIRIGGTGFFFDKAPDLPNYIEHHMPDYHLYDEYMNKRIEFLVNQYKERLINDIQLKKKKLKKNQTIEMLLEKKHVSCRNKYCDYFDFSIGFATRGCFRKCSFCVNKKYDRVHYHSPIKEFYDPSRKHIYLWDDNFMASPDFNKILDELDKTGKSFQFRQGLDIRLMTEEKAKRLSESKYYGDYIFAFDHIQDKELIAKNLKLWKKYCKKETKLYVLTAYDSQDEKDIKNTFERIKILMEHGCLPYIMRYEAYKDSRFKTFYIQLARWCNQPAFIKKQSFRQYCVANEEWHKSHSKHSQGRCSCYQAMLDFENEFPDIAKKYFDLRMEDIKKFPISGIRKNKKKPRR